MSSLERTAGGHSTADVGRMGGRVRGLSAKRCVQERAAGEAHGSWQVSQPRRLATPDLPSTAQCADRPAGRQAGAAAPTHPPTHHTRA